MAEEQPKLLGYANALYARMEQEVKASDEEMWHGMIVDTCVSLGIPQGGYNRVVNALRKMGCIEQIERGYRGNPSIYVLRKPPTVEVWSQAFVNSRDRDLTSAPSFDMLVGTVKELEERLGGLDVVKAFSNHESRIKELEAQVKSLTRQLNELAVNFN